MEVDFEFTVARLAKIANDSNFVGLHHKAQAPHATGTVCGGAAQREQSRARGGRGVLA